MIPQTYLATTATTNWTPIALTILGAAVGALISHLLTRDRDTRMKKTILDRESDIRKREFRRIISKSIAGIDHPVVPVGAGHDPWQPFNEALIEIISEFSLCDSDFTNADRLRDSITRARELTYQEATNPPNNPDLTLRNVLSNTLQDILTETKK